MPMLNSTYQSDQDQANIQRAANIINALKAFGDYRQKNKELKLEEQLSPAKSRYYDATAKGYYAMAGLDPMTGGLPQQAPTPQQVRGQSPMPQQMGGVGGGMGGMAIPQTKLPKVDDSFWDDAANGYNSFVQKAGKDPVMKKRVDDKLVSSLKNQFSSIPQWGVIEDAYQKGEIDALTAMDAIEAILNRGA